MSSTSSNTSQELEGVSAISINDRENSIAPTTVAPTTIAQTTVAPAALQPVNAVAEWLERNHHMIQTEISQQVLTQLINNFYGPLLFNEDPECGMQKRIMMIHVCILGKKAGVHNVDGVSTYFYDLLKEYVANQHIRVRRGMTDRPVPNEMNRNWKKIAANQDLYICLDLINVALANRDRLFLKNQIDQHRTYFKLERGHQINIHLSEVIVYDSGPPVEAPE